MSTEQAAETPARTGAEPPASRDARERAMWACRQHAAEAAAVREKTSARSREVLETKLEAVANRYWQYYEFSTGTNAKIAGKLRKERPVTALAWAGKIALAVMIAYPGHVAMGEILGYPASYALGFKAYLVTWPIVSVLLLAAELMIITGTVDFRLAGDARDYLYKGYNPGHYDRAYVYRRPDEIGTKRRLAWIFYGSAALLAL
ncbi:MAG: hypothetical protein FJZ00_09395, partial [Candidatus Sericytochromatia bacterium]|nr:hypothetical protein [Candidatus Tanganyikabacteria bacterium]